MENIPIYVTRKNAHGETGTISVGPRLFLILAALVGLNALGWLVYALIALVLAFVNLV